MTDIHKNPDKPVLLLTYDPLSRCDADPEAKERQILIDAVVAYVHDGGTRPSYEVGDLLAGEASICDSDVDWFFPVSMSMVEDDLSDSSLRAHEGLGDEDEITDEMRLKHGLRAIENLLNDGLQGDQPAASAIKIVDYRGRACLVAFELEGYSFSGVDCTTIGAFKDEQEIHLRYRKNSYLISPDDLDGARAKILANWDCDDPYAPVDLGPFADKENVVDMLLWKLSRNAWKFISEKYPDRVESEPGPQGALQSAAKEEKSHE